MIKRDEKKEAKKFGVVLGIGLAVVAGYFLWRGSQTITPYVMFGVGGVALLLPFIAPGLWLVLFRQWMKVAEAISWVMTRVILSVFFFGILTPVGLLMRVFGKRPLDLTWKDGKSTYWVEKAPGDYTVDRYRKQF